MKKNTGLPMKMEHLKLCPSGSLQRVLDLDLSPADDMPDAEYEDILRNVIINMNQCPRNVNVTNVPPCQCPCCCS